VTEIVSRWGAFDQATVDDPYPLYARLREAAPVTRATMAGGWSGWLVTGYDAARQVLTGTSLTKDLDRVEAAHPGAVPAGLRHPLVAHGMLVSDPPEHTRLRRLVTQAFTPTRVEAFRPRVQAITDELLDALDGGTDEPVDLIDRFAFRLPITVLCEMLAVPPGDRSRLESLIEVMFSSPVAPANNRQAWAAANEVSAYLRSLLDERRRNPADDTLSALLAASSSGDRLTLDELLSSSWLLLVAGHETTVNLIGNAMVELLVHPDERAALAVEPKRIPAAIEELLRHSPPVHQTTFRMTTGRLTVSGVTIPAHEQVLVVLAAAGRDPARFTEPDRLDLERDECPHLAFGHGIHFCLGAALARLEGEVAIASLLARFPDVRLAIPRTDLHWHNRLALRKLRSLPVFLR
jgi:cytochrome P450